MRDRPVRVRVRRVVAERRGKGLRIPRRSTRLPRRPSPCEARAPPGPGRRRDRWRERPRRSGQARERTRRRAAPVPPFGSWCSNERIFPSPASTATSVTPPLFQKRRRKPLEGEASVDDVHVSRDDRVDPVRRDGRDGRRLGVLHGHPREPPEVRLRRAARRADGALGLLGVGRGGEKKSGGEGGRRNAAHGPIIVRRRGP